MAQSGSAPGLGPGGPRFESLYSDHSLGLNTSMKELLRNLSQILGFLPEIIKYLKYIPVLMILGAIGYGAYYYMQNHKDPYKCVNNQVFEQIRVDSDIYVFKGETCVDANDLK